jgi:DNA-binding NtrC family response regulator
VPGCAFSADAAEALLLAAWPYNVRQLQQEVKAAAIRAAAPEIGLAHLAAALRGPLEGRAAQPEASPPIPLALRVPRERAPDAEGLAEAMAHFEGNVARVAEYFGRERRQIYRWLAGFGLDPEGFRR